MRPLQPFASVLLSGLLLAMAPALFSPAPAAEARIEDFRFECRAPDGKRLKPKFGDVDGVFFTGLPGQRDACVAAVDRMIATCHENTSFTSNTRNREYAGCLPIFKAQAQECAAFFRNERRKCDAGGSGSAGLGDGGAAPDPWSDGGSTGGDSVWNAPAAEAADSGDRTQTAAWASPAPAADSGGEADPDVSSYASALSEVLGDAPQPEAAQDDYTGALAALEAEARRVAELRRQTELEAEREAALRAERQALREMQERAEREAEHQAERERQRANLEAWKQVGDNLMQQAITLQRERQAAEERRARREERRLAREREERRLALEREERRLALEREEMRRRASTVGGSKRCDQPGGTSTC